MPPTSQAPNDQDPPSQHTLWAETRRVGLVAGNSAAYVQTALDLISDGYLVVPLRHADDSDRLQLARATEVITPIPGAGWVSPRFAAREDESPAMMAFTSGTEGKPKGVLLTHRNLADPVRRLNSTMQVSADIREYIGAPAYYSFGFGRCRAVAQAGGQCYLPPQGFNPAEIGSLLERGQINAISAVPSLWRMLLANRDLIGAHGRDVRWIEIGSQYMTRAEKLAMKALFPNARMVLHYGLTEASRTTLLSLHDVDGDALDSVGRALGGVEVKQTPDGRIAIRGPHVASAYLIDGLSVPLTDAQGWFTTNDLGQLREGWLHYEGRADDVVNCGGIKVDPEALEARVNSALGTDGQHLAICRRPHALRGEGFLVAVTRDAGLDLPRVREATVRAVQAMGINAPDAVDVVQTDALPRTSTGKLQRKQLAAAHAAAAEVQAPPSTAPAISADLAELFRRVLKLREVGPQDSFITLGGDSLSYVQLAMELERHLGYLPGNWEHLSIAELRRLPHRRRRLASIETGFVLRALAIVCIVGLHAKLSPHLSGGASMLMIIVGANLARFQSPALFGEHWFQPIVKLVKHLVLPYWGLSVAYQAWKQQLDIPELLLVANYFGVERVDIFPTWFVSVMVQCLLLLSLAFALRPLRERAARSPWPFGAVATLLAIAAMQMGPYIWDTSELYNRVPHMQLWLITLGWMIHMAEDLRQKAYTTALLLAVVLPLALGGNVAIDTMWVVGGGLLLLWLPSVRVPTLLRRPIQIVGASVFYIYLTHIIWQDILERRLHVHMPWASTLAGVLGGVLVWFLVERLAGWWSGRRESGVRAI